MVFSILLAGVNGHRGSLSEVCLHDAVVLVEPSLAMKLENKQRNFTTHQHCCTNDSEFEGKRGEYSFLC